MQDLYPEKPRKRTNGRDRGKIVTAYNYRDEGGKLLYQAVRIEPKDFRQRRPTNGHEGPPWTWNVKGVRKVPYRLPELLQADGAVYVVEGEKDVDALARTGLIATCNVGGAGKWSPDLSPHLEGRPVAILPDNDAPGRKHAAQVADALQGIASSVKVVELPELPDKGDVSDWLGNGGSVSALFKLVETAPAWTPPPATTTAPAAPQGPALTDLGNSDRFVAKYTDELRYCHPWRMWLRWDGLRWRRDLALEVLELAKAIPRDLFTEFQRVMDKDLGEWALTSQSKARVEALVALARSAIPVPPERLDRPRWLLNVTNGTLDLRTGQRRAPDRDEYMTTQAPVRFDPAATCPAWDRFLERIMNGNQDLVSYLQRAVGYSLTGDVGEQCLFFLHGDGANGKSTFIEAVQAAMGHEFSKTAAPNILMASKHENHPTELADLHGVRFVSTVEVEEGRRFNEVKLKQLTGGDRIRARRMREDFWEFEPTHKIWLAANHKPVIRGTDLAIWRRVRLVPFTVTIPPEERDRDLPAKLRAELPGILAWAVRGCMEWQRGGLQDPDEVKAATHAYRQEMDVLQPFLDEKCVVDPLAVVGKSELYAAYKKWADEGGVRPLNKNLFGRRLLSMGFQDGRSKSKRSWLGVGLTLPLPIEKAPK